MVLDAAHARPESDGVVDEGSPGLLRLELLPVDEGAVGGVQILDYEGGGED